LVTGDGMVSFLVKSTSSDGARYYSKESGTAAQAPQLQVTCGTGGGGDVTAPTSPGNLTATPTSSSRVDLSWTAATDDAGVTGHKVYRDGSTTPLATLGGTTLSYADTTVSASTMYTYQVSAADAAGH